MGEPTKGGRPIPVTYQVEYNSLRLARTAINHAYWGANKAAAKLNPLCGGMRWILSDEHFTRQVQKWGPDICDDYAKHDEGLGVGVFPVDSLPLPHPQCLCRQEQVLPTTEEAVERLNWWLAGGSDPALDRGFALARKRAEITNATNILSTYKADGIRISPQGSETISDDVTKLIQAAHAKLVNDYPILNDVITEILVGNEPDVAAFRLTYNQLTGSFRTSVLIDSGYWRSMDSLRDVLRQSLESGHSKGVIDPMAILAHEYGHGVHNALALKAAGYDPVTAAMTAEQFQAFIGARRQIALDVFSESGAFDSEEFGTSEAIYQAIENEMGKRATEGGGEELIAQAVAMEYNGTAGPIGRAIARYLKGRMRRVMASS